MLRLLLLHVFCVANGALAVVVLLLSLSSSWLSLSVLLPFLWSLLLFLLSLLLLLLFGVVAAAGLAGIVVGTVVLLLTGEAGGAAAARATQHGL